MIEFKTGDMFAENVEALVNSVNCMGVMGRGIALEFKRRFPENYTAYRAACERREVQPGKMFVHEFQQVTLESPLRYIINFPTKRHWRSKSKLADVEAGLRALANEIHERGIHSIAMPALATDLGGLSWSEVRPAIETALAGIDAANIYVFNPDSGKSDGRPNRSRTAPLLTPKTAAMICLIDSYVRCADDPDVTERDVQLLLHLLQHAGADLDPQFQQLDPSPSAPDAAKLLYSLRTHYLTLARHAELGAPRTVRLIPGAAQEAAEILNGFDEMRERVEQVKSLIDGFETAFGLQLLTTVHSVANANDPRAHWQKLVRAVSVQGDGQFNPDEARPALKALRDHRFLPRERRVKRAGNGATPTQPTLPANLESADPITQEELAAVTTGS